MKNYCLTVVVEVGRFKGTPEHLHLCELYDLQIVENYICFVLYCHLYCDLRSD